MTDDLKELDDKLEKHASRVKEIGDEIRENLESESTEAKARMDELQAEQHAITEKVAPLLAAKEKAEQAAAVAATQSQLEALMAQTRTASKASYIGAGRSVDPQVRAGAFLGALMDTQPTIEGWSPDRHAKAISELESITAHEDSWGKAVLGTSDATGGWIIPNALVDSLIKPAAHKNPFRELMTVISGVTSASVDIPFRSASPNRAVIAPFGDTKENVNLAYNGYTATMYTLARIHDVGAQFVRQSAGAAEQDVLQELATAFALGEAYYIREGSGSSEPFGYTSALTNGPAAFRSSFTPASTTLAGSIMTAIATAAGALAGRGRTPDGAVLAATAYWTMASQGIDGTGFFYAPANGPRDIRPNTLLTPWGLPVYPDSSADATGTAAVLDNLVVAEWKSFKVFFGDSYRVDSSNVAGERWDRNLVGFRGEEEMGFDARPGVYSGIAQMITDVLP